MIEEILEPSFRITKATIEKANHIARRIKDLSGMPLECYMWFAKGGDGIIKDVYIIDSQDVTYASCTIGGTGKEISHWRMEKENLSYAGWCHSHGIFY